MKKSRYFLRTVKRQIQLISKVPFVAERTWWLTRSEWIARPRRGQIFVL